MRKNQSGFAHLALLLVIVIVLIAGVGVYVYKHNKKSSTANSETSETKSSLVAPLPADLLTVDKVKALAATEAPNVDLTSVQLEQESGVYLYKVKLANGTILFFNGQTGVKVTHDAGENEATSGNIPTGFTAGITYDKARQIALSQKPGGVISKIELELEEGKVVYSVRFSDEARVDIDATNGSVVSTKPAKTQSTSSSNSGSESSKSSESGSESGSSNKSPANDDSSHGGSGSSGSGRNRPAGL